MKSHDDCKVSAREELIGTLTAISVVSRSLAKKLVAVKERENYEKGEKSHGKRYFARGGGGSQ